MSATSHPEHPARAGLVHLAWATATLALAIGLTYVAPGLDTFRPWVPGEALPLSSVVKSWGYRRSLPAFAGAGSGYLSTSEATGQGPDLRESVTANLGAPASDKEPREDRPPGFHVEPKEYAGIEVPIVDPDHRGLKPFYDALRETASRKPGAITRVAHYGDSSIATDLITHTVRRRLQRRFGDAGHGFLLVARGHMPWRHRDVSHQATGPWKLRELVRSALRDGYYGYGGVQYRGVAGARALFGTDAEAPVGQRVSRFEVFFQRGRPGGLLHLRVDGGEPEALDTRGGPPGDAYHVIEVPDGAHELDVRVMRGQPLVYGVAMERDVPGVVYDSLGLVGARARRLLNYDSTHIAAQLRHRDVNLIILGFGGNEADDRMSKVEDYEEEFVRVIQVMRPDPESMGCLVFAPLDQGHRGQRGRIVTMPAIPKIVEAQERAARRAGCAFFNTFEAMGGKGAMQSWYRARPRLAMGDFRHATPAGYEVIGNLFYKALLQDLAKYAGR